MTRRLHVGAALATAAVLAIAACGGGTATTPTSPEETDNGSESASDNGTADPGERHVWKFAFNQPDTHPLYIAMMDFAEKLEAATDGRYVIEGYPNELLGSQGEVMENVVQGTVELAMTAGPLVETYSPDFGVFNLPYQFDTVEAQIAIFNNAELMAPLYTSMEESKNITVLGGFTAGFRNIYSNKPISTPADLNGMKIRVQQSDSQIDMMAALGGVGTPMGQGDVYTALQSGVLDGAENNEIIYHGLKHDEVAKVYSYTKHLVGTDFLLAATNVLDAMSPEDRAALESLLPGLQDMGNTLFLELVKDNREMSIETTNATFHEDVDTAAFKALVQDVVDKYLVTDKMKEIAAAIEEANAANK